jgi:hypothetical protein
MLATFAAERRIQNDAAQVGIAIHRLAEYCGVSKSVLADQLSNGKLPEKTAEKVSEVLEVMKLLRKEVGLPIDWTSTVVIKPILQDRLEKFRESKDPIPPRIYLIKLGSLNYFQIRRGDEIISTPSESKAALFETYDQATEAAELLKKLNRFAAVTDWSNSLKFRRSELVQRVDDLGLLDQ